MTPTEIHECLEKLGKTADEVHTSLLVMGIRGRRLRSCHCPLANYIKSITNESGVSVSPWRYEVNHVYTVMPKGCTEFVSNFDDGFYPDLVAV